MSLTQKYKNWKNAENPAPVDWEHIKKFITGYWRKYFPLTPKWVEERAKWRLSRAHPQCKEMGSCRLCGCGLQELVYPNDNCDGKCWDSTSTKKQWNTYKKFNNIKL